MLATPQVSLYESLLKNSWQRICQQLSLQAHFILTAQVYQELLDCYSQPHRAYHSVQHLAECIDLFEQVGHLAAHPAQLELALWFHDAIYQTQPSPDQSNPAQNSHEQPSNQRRSNEQRSADWAAQFLNHCDANPAMIEQVIDLIMATQHHQASDADEQLMIDIDLAILGSTPTRFAQYQQQISKEYDFVEPALFAVKRREVLAGFFQRPRIYQTAYFYEHYEQQARQNLQDALNAL
ncbi:MAG: N-methyl-D-aspartate receptor NMDAR2C subunit [Moraxellaceae bacterium]|nr:MAG: N-methyl-D-aspartate receptor NMDAR2C subunit [Moraxellaceae bacterium]